MIKLLEGRAAVRAGMCEREELRYELDEVRRKLECLDSCFDRTDDEALIESLIYQHNGMMAHYGYLLHRAKVASQAEAAPQAKLSSPVDESGLSKTAPQAAAQHSNTEVQPLKTPYQGRATAG